ncbi:type I 3-dehydroquinate dehydratase [[Clostridium] polysaccharolyticum]|jgi:3-dehydroquinate dehydratase-1|uniref:3-dehydroquinate dehydratase n=1 Tax=[Clostridium] polysaccharolyticum TaxID=29364 RepID=A0A1I0D0C4_9FIRM|nr:type I 3-dehydroquinate dehydratase [[Clostridium] polysaccharolyticum]SET25618.1 3-dehydroquinate dehydratase [[Clostridium] polysaccharolyticum]
MIKIREIEFGAGTPKICVPITGRTQEEIFEQAKKIAPLKVEVVEWRVDYVQFLDSEKTILSVLKSLRNILGEKILLFTFRTKKEGGEQELEIETYLELNRMAAETGFVDLVDLEIFSSKEKLGYYIEMIHNAGCKIIASNHDFFKTPSEEEIISRLGKMEQAGADILKIAVMPQSAEDVATLLRATSKAASRFNKPVVTMSMAKLGAVSRMTGEVFGSAMTFGTVGEASAPGQIPVGKLREFLDFFSFSDK